MKNFGIKVRDCDRFLVLQKNKIENEGIEDVRMKMKQQQQKRNTLKIALFFYFM